MAIGKAIEARLGERRGRPEKEGKFAHISDPGVRTRKLAAEAAGFKERSYEAAKKVIEQAAQEVIDEMDQSGKAFDFL